MARFLVRFLEDPRGHARPAPDAETAVEAAVLFVERQMSEVETAGEVAVSVCDCETGLEQCFRIDLADDAVGPC
jgi:hypothetical protein